MDNLKNTDKRLPQILVVDDDDDLNYLISTKLVRLGYSVERLSNGKEVVLSLEKYEDVLLLLDYKLPDMTAGELIEIFTTENRNIPFIIMTGYADVKTAVELMKLGARDYLIKGSNFLDLIPSILKQVIDELIIEKRLFIAERALVESEKKFRALYDNAIVGMMTIRADNQIISGVNDLGRKILGYQSKEEIIDRICVNDLYITHNKMPDVFEDFGTDVEISGNEVQIIRKNGSTVWAIISSRLYPEENKIDCVFADISRRKNAEERVYNLTFYDQLTKLPNKELFKSYIDNEIVKAKKRGKNNLFSIMCLGIDKFKNVNNLYGNEVGNSLLRVVGKRLKNSIFKKDTIARLEGDKFMILFSDIASREDMGRIVQKTRNSLLNNINIDGNNISASASIGICLYPEDGNSVEILMKNSEIAMYMAKSRGLNTHFFDAELNDEVVRHFQLEKDLREAIDKREFVVFYQPKVTSDGKIIGMESLIRWQSPDRGLVPPFKFIPIAEKNGMIIEIGDFILRQSCIQNKSWQDQGLMPVRVSVNLSSYQFGQYNLVSGIEKIIKETGLSPEWLELEITESGIIENEKDSINKIKEIHQLGISVSIDDFGTGYSSLSKLKDYPIDTLKIDKFFIDNIPIDKKSSTIATTIIDLAHNLDFNVIAEGVETKEQVDFLVSNGCDQFQGYYFSKALPADKFEEKLKI